MASSTKDAERLPQAPSRNPPARLPPRLPPSLIIACGALGREIVDTLRLSGWTQLQVTCLPAIWHNRPQKIPEGVRGKIRAARARGIQHIFVAYGDCGTGGLLDQVLEEEGVLRLPGPHCYAFYSGQTAFEEMADRDPTCFYLTDYLTRHFDRLIIEGLALDRHPELLPDYFGNYTKLVYLAQIKDPGLEEKARAAADFLKLQYDYRYTGLGELGDFLATAARAGEA